MEMQTRNSTGGNRNVMSIEPVEGIHNQHDSAAQTTAVAMHPHHYLSHPSHSQMMGMPQMTQGPAIENHFQVAVYLTFYSLSLSKNNYGIIRSIV